MGADNGLGRFIGPNACAAAEDALQDRVSSLRGLSLEFIVRQRLPGTLYVCTVPNHKWDAVELVLTSVGEADAVCEAIWSATA